VSKRGIDHLVLCVRDLEEARLFYERLGFTTTPTGHHDWGTSNFLVQFDGAFLEVLTVTRPELLLPQTSDFFSFGQRNADFLEKGEGLSMLVFEGFDSRGDQQDFVNAGIGEYQPFDFTRQAKQPDGSSVEVSFSLAFATDPKMPGLAFFTCHQGAPEYFWKPAYQQHANGGVQIGTLTLSSADPETHRGFFDKLCGGDNISVIEAGYQVGLSRGHLEVVKGEGDAKFSSFAVTVRDLDQTEQLLSRNDVEFNKTNDALRVAADQAFGIEILFSEK
jgi:catechol 2,3-dioxygenase-like lactoylglutathione lyase family enzyme